MKGLTMRRLTAFGLVATIGIGVCGSWAQETSRPGTAPAGVPATAPVLTTMPAGQEVTITGSLMCNWATLAAPKAKADEPNHPEHNIVCIYAIDGSPTIKAEIDKVMADYFPDAGLDGEAGKKLLDQWEGRLKFYIARGTPAGEQFYTRRHTESSAGCTLKGVVFEKDGFKWLAVSSVKEVTEQEFGTLYPEKMRKPDKPLVMPDKEPLALKVSDTLSIKCYKIPAGKYQEGSYFFMHKRFPEEYPHLVTLTKPFYMAECPVTQETWEAVMGSNPSFHKDPQVPVENPQILDINKFCQVLSEKTGRKVRMPTDAEWEYVNRVGTSNPPLVEKYESQYCGLPGRMVKPVKSAQPNAWGFYDMASGWWEFVADNSFYNPRTPQVDQFFPPNDSNARGQHRGRGLWAYNHNGSNVEFMPSNPRVIKQVPEKTENTYASQTFRVAVDADADVKPPGATQPK
jgi:hypothetical protein